MPWAQQQTFIGHPDTHQGQAAATATIHTATVLLINCFTGSKTIFIFDFVLSIFNSLLFPFCGDGKARLRRLHIGGRFIRFPPSTGKTFPRALLLRGNTNAMECPPHCIPETPGWGRRPDNSHLSQDEPLHRSRGKKKEIESNQTKKPPTKQNPPQPRPPPPTTWLQFGMRLLRDTGGAAVDPSPPPRRGPAAGCGERAGAAPAGPAGAPQSRRGGRPRPGPAPPGSRRREEPGRGGRDEGSRARKGLPRWA